MLFFNLPSFFENLELNIALREINTFHPEYFKTQITFHVSTGNFPYQYWNGGFNNNGLKNINLSYDKISQFQSMYNIPIRFNCSNIFINENDYFDTNMNVILNIFENGANQIEISNLNFYDYLIKKYKNFNYVFSKNSDLIYPIDENILNIINEQNLFKIIQIPEEKALDFNFLNSIKNKKNIEIPIMKFCNNNCKCYKECQYNEHNNQYNFSKINFYRNCYKNLPLEINSSVITIEDIIEKYKPMGFKYFYIPDIVHNKKDNLLQFYINYFIKNEFKIEVYKFFQENGVI